MSSVSLIIPHWEYLCRTGWYSSDFDQVIFATADSVKWLYESYLKVP